MINEFRQSKDYIFNTEIIQIKRIWLPTELADICQSRLLNYNIKLTPKQILEEFVIKSDNSVVTLLHDINIYIERILNPTSCERVIIYLAPHLITIVISTILTFMCSYLILNISNYFLDNTQIDAVFYSFNIIKLKSVTI